METRIVLNLHDRSPHVVTLCVELDDAEMSAICRACNVSEPRVAIAIRDAAKADIQRLVTLGFRGMEADDLARLGHIEVGRANDYMLGSDIRPAL